jgi:hypothetical protein
MNRVLTAGKRTEITNPEPFEYKTKALATAPLLPASVLQV